MLLSPELLRTLDAPTKAIVLVEVRMSRRVSSAFRNDMLLNANVRERFQSIRDRASIPSAIESLQILDTTKNTGNKVQVRYKMDEIHDF